MDKTRLSFFVLFTPYGRLTVVKIRESYYWLELRLRVRFRGRGYAKRIIEAGLHNFVGQHHIHFNPRLSSVMMCARKYKWRFMGESSLFEGCDHYATKTMKIFDHSFPINIVERRQCPTLTAYRKGHSLRVMKLLLIHAT